MGREIHDTLLQRLVGVSLQFDSIADTFKTSPQNATASLVRVRRQIAAAVRDARMSIWDYPPPILENRDLQSALQEFGERLTDDSSVAFSMRLLGEVVPISPKLEGELLRVGQEAITNAVRHAHARHITVELECGDDLLHLRVKDDGSGFDAEWSETLTQGHYGLLSMRERVAEIGGQLTILTARGAGTLVETSVPIVLNEPA
jgi:signal transduction histidine kinase